MAEAVLRLREALAAADAVFIGAGAGLSTAAGFTYSGARFDRYFRDLGDRYGYEDMYSGGFYPYERPEQFWAFWSRNIWVNRYMDPPGTAYGDLYRLVRDRDYFVLTTNVDHCFQKAGFAKERLFYTQGDYGLFQCSRPCCRQTWDNEAAVRQMVLAQGLAIGEGGALSLPESGAAAEIPSALLPVCPRCGRPAALNLRSDGSFVEDAGWKAAAARYEAWTAAHARQAVVYLELGVGSNTPGIIKYNFWQQVYRNERALYACLNPDPVPVPAEIRERSVCIREDCRVVLAQLRA